MRTFISYQEALETVLGCAEKGGPEDIKIEHAIGRVLFDSHESPMDVPPFASSAMDGFAVQSADFEGENPSLRLIDNIPAGQVPKHKLGSGTCAEIMTGAMIPEGADSIIPVELLEARTADEVSFRPVVAGGKHATRNKHVRPAAEELKIGDVVFQGGELITPPVIGMLATIGHTPVRVVKKPLVAVISTGDEIVSPGSDLGPGQIRNSNGPALRGQVLSAGGNCPSFQHVSDDKDAIRQSIERNMAADLIVFSGGVSMGAHDHIKGVLNDMGAELLFWKVRQRPGKPLAFGKIRRPHEMGETHFLGLPGNPVSSAMCFEVYARPMIQKMLGMRQGPEKKITATLAKDITTVQGLHFFTRGIVSQQPGENLVVEDAGPQQSNLYGSVVRANCIIHIPENDAVVLAGQEVEIEILPWSSLR